MCQKIVTILWKDDPKDPDYVSYQRSTCPNHPSNKLRLETGCGECGWNFCGGRNRVKFAKSNKKVSININGVDIDVCPTHRKFLREDVGCPDCHWDFLPAEMKSHLQPATV